MDNEPGIRHQGRCAALQLLYQLDVQGLRERPERGWDEFFAHFEPELDRAARSFAEQLVDGAVGRLARIDELLDQASSNWRLVRMDRVDRCVLRLGTAELVGDRQLAPAIVISEAVELAKSFGSERSGKFVNGVLGQVARLLREPKASPAV